MSEPALDTPPKQAASKKAPSQTTARPRADREPHPIGDDCLKARIVGRQQIEGNKARLLIAFPRGADVRVGGSGHVNGVADSGFKIQEITEGTFAVAHTYGRVDMAGLEGHTSAMIECAPRRTRATKPVEARIIKREQIGDKIKITIAAGFAQGVFRGMTGKLTAPNAGKFTVAEVEYDNSCFAFVTASHDTLLQYPNVVIDP